MLGSHKTPDVPPLVDALKKYRNLKEKIENINKKKKNSRRKKSINLKNKKAISEGLGAYGNVPINFEYSLSHYFGNM
jgi:hypothetical protein